ncbi:hypothetical protein [Streptomyces omiyaensis]|uniref:hypothetical protein n=1 Tax=Streptomyces omiyaensis TaxID=68247 RepID=UPI003702010F
MSPRTESDICPDCGGLAIWTWDRLDGATGVRVDGPLRRRGSTLGKLAQPGPCHLPATERGPTLAKEGGAQQPEG